MRVAAEGVGHRFDGHPPLFEGLNFTLIPGRIYALTGPSGSGKSTLLHILAGWISPTSGAIVRDAVDSVAWVFQNPHGVPKRTAIDHVMLPLLARGATLADARREAERRLAAVKLSGVAGSLFRELSGGEAQRLMLARGLASRPDLLLVDEPTAQLDSRTAQSVSAVLSAMADDGTIVVIATHDARTREACTDVIDLEGTA